jgi:hypothetical protein
MANGHRAAARIKATTRSLILFLPVSWRADLSQAQREGSHP